MILIVNPKSPVETFASQIQPEKVALYIMNCNFFLALKFDADAGRDLILRNQCAERCWALLALQVPAFRFAIGSQITPDENLPMDEEIVVEDRGCARHQERLLGRLGGVWRRNFFSEKIVARNHRQRTAGGLAPLVAKQVAGSGDYQFRFLADRIRARGLLELRFDLAGAFFLRNAERLGGDWFPFDEDSERTGVDRLRGRGFRLVLLVAVRSGISGNRRGQKQDHATADGRCELHSISPCSTRISIFFKRNFFAISAAMASTVRSSV